ncbi:MAG: insulinase family protein, partial [Parasporobacterium sp.]|nr:insulinase family protein [Parasporobacterium sp.]
MSFRNYTTVFEKDSEDLNSRVYLLRHTKTGARVFLLSNDDKNKVFYVGFRTTPSDDTGVAHIMEHSVLCGSEKYPLKDPFVELVKGSLNTFLNAMTYPDKTVYPCASMNDKDFKNLMSVYMDAVFHPNIYKHPEILKQEGWNYSIKDADAPIEYNGVVYNEMKGAFSSPEGVLERETLHAMFPDVTYGHESGGDPACIPDLTYEQFLDFHRTYYHPSNSYIFLYGDMDLEERLDWMDREYLSHYDPIRVDSEIGKQPDFEQMAIVRKEYAISEDEPEENNTYLSYNIHCGTNLDPYKYYAMQMIQYALVDTQGAPVRQRLLDEGIGKDILSGFDTGLKQEYFSIISKNAEASQAERFLEIINDEFRKAADGQLNHRSLTASLNSLEFKYKEADFGGYPKGLIYGLNALD